MGRGNRQFLLLLLALVLQRQFSMVLAAPVSTSSSSSSWTISGDKSRNDGVPLVLVQVPAPLKNQEQREPQEGFPSPPSTPAIHHPNKDIRRHLSGDHDNDDDEDEPMVFSCPVTSIDKHFKHNREEGYYDVRHFKKVKSESPDHYYSSASRGEKEDADKSNYYKGKGKACLDSRSNYDNNMGKTDFIPPSRLTTLAEILESRLDEFSILIQALQGTGLWDLVGDPNIPDLTLFAPTDKAFADLEQDTLIKLLQDPFLLLTDILLYHVIGCRVTSQTLLEFMRTAAKKKNHNDQGVPLLYPSQTVVLPTLLSNTTTLNVILSSKKNKRYDYHNEEKGPRDRKKKKSTTLKILVQGSGNDGSLLPKVVEANLVACNGVIHVVDKVILPPKVEPLPRGGGSVPTSAEYVSSRNDLSVWTQAIRLVSTSVYNTLNDPTVNLTLLAPTDDAFGNLPPDAVDYLMSNPDVLESILLYHMIDAFLPSSDLALLLVDGAEIPTLLWQGNSSLQVMVVNDNGIYLNGTSNNHDEPALVTEADIDTANGRVHIINRVLLPALLPVGATLFFNGFSELTAALEATDLSIAVIQDPSKSWTVLAPTDVAFRNTLEPDAIQFLRQYPDVWRDILLSHVVRGTIRASDLLALPSPIVVSTLLDQPLKFHVVVDDDDDDERSNVPTILLSLRNGSNQGNITVTSTDLDATNGIIHSIDVVLIPPLPVGNRAGVEGFTLFVAALEYTGLLSTFNNAMELNSTVFVPTNAAWEAIGLNASSLGTFDVDELRMILWTHVVSDALLSHVRSSLFLEFAAITTSNGLPIRLPTASGVNLTVMATLDEPDRIFVQGYGNNKDNLPELINSKVDILATNGILHVINGILLPQTKKCYFPKHKL
ncbi:hypothetical protein ACA910_004650 [Epithemia clementina (nom. ined.)]